MTHDRYGLGLSTGDQAAAAYVAGVDALFAADVGAAEAFGRAIGLDPDFALAHAALARTHQVFGNRAGAKAAITRARELAPKLKGREASHVNCMGLVIDGQGTLALDAIRAHLREWPRDAVALSPCTGVFGLYGFSGLAHRAASLRALLDGLAPQYGDDWWFLAMQAFAHVETGSVESGREKVTKALATNPRDAHAMHILAHVHYEAGEVAEGRRRLADFIVAYPREGLMHCHINWHRALWALVAGDTDEAWKLYAANVAPGSIWGPSLNVLTDAAAFLFRAELMGSKPPEGAWAKVLDYARKEFPRPGLAFVDVHVALAAAMAGDGTELEARAKGTRGPAQPVVERAATGFLAFARADWSGAIDAFGAMLPEHERLGGSRAQRDLFEEALLAAYRHAGRAPDPAALTRRH
ncbi:MAG: tetratricopeptide repeat protein [Rhodospirillales bacterium]|nr:tetratricopeptide repeat protein [Rhodospirillales bacterium]